MAAIPPSTEIRILSGCKLKPDYKHSIWWNNPISQYQYFSGLTKHTLVGSQYTRSTDNSIKVPLSVAQLLNCNYLIFINSGHEKKDYYAFITNVKYVSEGTSLIEYEIDLIQTWYFECTLEPCLVEREHSITDEIGDNLLPEPVDTGDYVTFSDGVLTPSLMENVIAVATTTDIMSGTLNGDMTPKMYGRTFSGLYLGWYDTTEQGITYLKQLISYDGLAIPDIVQIFMCPKFCMTDGAEVIKVPKCYEPFNGYVPHNKKLFTYPYNFLRISAGDCGIKDYRYEFFTSDKNNAVFYLRGDASLNPGVLLTPTSYKVQNPDGLPANLYEDSMMLTGFPQCPWSSDMFLAFMSQVLSTAVSVVADVSSFAGIDRAPAISPWGGPTYTQTGVGLMNNIASDTTALMRPETSVKTVSNSGTLFNFGELTYKSYEMRITEERARIIDDYFDLYGYACNTVKLPNRTSRPHWNYVKTANCCISASLPSDIIINIQNIYNRGITFWANGNEVGNYYLDNTI